MNPKKALLGEKRMLLIIILLLLLPSAWAMNMSAGDISVNAYMSSITTGYEDLPDNYTVYYGLSQTHIGNETVGNYTTQVGLFYLVFSDVTNFSPPAALINFIIDIKDFGIEWVKINFT